MNRKTFLKGIVAGLASMGMMKQAAGTPVTGKVIDDAAKLKRVRKDMEMSWDRWMEEVIRPAAREIAKNIDRHFASGLELEDFPTRADQWDGATIKIPSREIAQ